MFMFDLAALFKLSLSFKNHAIYPKNSYFSLKFEQKELSVFVCTNVGRVPLISGAAGTVYVSRSMQIKIGFSYANRAKCFCKSTCLCVCKSGASNVSINNVHRLNWTIALQIKISRFRTCLQHNVFNHIWKLIRKNCSIVSLYNNHKIVHFTCWLFATETWFTDNVSFSLKSREEEKLVMDIWQVIS